jgi:Cu-Zn family superoxide dismutase
MKIGRLAAAVMVCGAVGLAAQGAMMGTAKAEMKDATGKSLGTLTLTDTPHGVMVQGTLTGLPEGVHAIHIHTTGKCDAPAFTTAGGHFNPASKQHGIENPMGMHGGDLPNITVAGGKLTFDLFAPDATLKAGANSLLDADGSAVVIHATADDYKSDPAGNAGARIACGVVTK